MGVTMQSELIFVGDIHLGRRPSGLSEVLTAIGVSAGDLAPHAAWAVTVREAIERRARAVVLAGDVVEGERDRFEAYGQLERGVRALAEAGVPVFGVAGNHDGLVLPRLASRIEGFHLLGAGGIWERVEVPGAGAPIDLIGWSFPTRYVTEDPLGRPDFAATVGGRRAGAALIGVLHADLDQAGSRYAPVRRASLEGTPMDAWLLGHIHQPSELAGPRPIGYLGSLTGLDAGEVGARGPWAVTVQAGLLRATQIPLAPVRWERLEVGLTGTVPDADAVHARLEAAVRTFVGGLFDVQGGPDARLRAVILRAALTGQLDDPRGAARYAADHRAVDAIFEVDGIPCVVERVTDATVPAVDLERLAEEPTPAGRIARRIQALEAGRVDDLVAVARQQIQMVTTGRWALDADRHAAPDAEALLLAAAWRALELLLAQRRGPEVA